MQSHFTAIRENQVEADQFCPSNLFRDCGPPVRKIPPRIIHQQKHTTTDKAGEKKKPKHFVSPILSLSFLLSHSFFSIQDKFKRSKLENQMRALGSRRDLQSCRPALQSLIHHVPQVVNSSSICKCFQILANLYAPRFIMENQL